MRNSKMNRMSGMLTILLAFGWMAGCQKSLKEVRETYRSDVMKKMEKLKDIDSQLKTITVANSPGQVRLDTPLSVIDESAPSVNGMVVAHDQLVDPSHERKQEQTPWYFGSDHRKSILKILDGTSFHEDTKQDAKFAEEDLKNFLGLKYVIVIRDRQWSEPKVIGEGKFSGGYYEGEVLLFNFDDAKYLGGFAVKMTPYSSMTVDKASGNFTDQSNLTYEFTKQIKEVINDRMKQHFSVEFFKM